MRMKLVWTLLVGITCIFSATNLTAKSEAATGGNYTTKDQEYYLTSEQMNFIRPGLELEILDTVIPADLLTEVTFRITDPAGLPLDRTGVNTPGPVSTSFILAFIPAGEEAYLSYTSRIQTSPITEESAEQASTDSGGSYTDMGDGTYKYKFGTAVPADYDTNTTHTMGMYARRDLTEFDLDRYVANELDHFVPSGSSMPMPRSIVTTETCNGRCHDPIALHGGSRQEVGLCILCHNPNQDIDPDTGNSVDMPLMIHKIHMGANLENGYNIIGYRQTDHDYSHVEYPAGINECEACHTGGVPTDAFPMVATPATALVCDSSRNGETVLTWNYENSVQINVRTPSNPDGSLFALGGPTGSQATGKWVKDGTQFDILDKGTQELLQTVTVNATVLGCVGNAPGTARGEAAVDHTNWLNHTTRKNCGSCHDWVDFETGEGHASGIPQADDSNCTRCHKADTGVEFDLSVKGSHTALYKSEQFPGVLVDLLDITNTNAGNYPKATFSVRSKDAPIDPATMNRLRLSISGPNEDFDFYVAETVGENAVKAGENWTYRFHTPLPRDAMGSYTLGVEGRNIIEIDFGHDEIAPEEDQAENSVMAFAVTDSVAQERREVVSDYKCESCHSNLSLHGDNRKNVNYCNTCHQPDLTDAVVRPEGEFPDQSVHMKYMIHKIHRGQELENGYLVYGYRSSVHDFGHVEYSGDLRNCNACHVNNSQQIDLPAGVLPTVTPQDWWTPTLPEAAACLSCHDDDSSAAHAYSNTTFFGESCATCHGDGKEWSVDKVHAQ
jgi:hypothetical protein